jgi:hypothetical protein
MQIIPPHTKKTGPESAKTPINKKAPAALEEVDMGEVNPQGRDGAYSKLRSFVYIASVLTKLTLKVYALGRLLRNRQNPEYP